MHYGHSGYKHDGDLQMLVIAYYVWDGQGIGTKPGAELAWIDENSENATLLTVENRESYISLFKFKLINNNYYQWIIILFHLLIEEWLY